MAETSSQSNLAPVTEAALLADRLSFWSSFTSATTYAVVAIVCLVLAMWIFLVLDCPPRLRVRDASVDWCGRPTQYG